MVGEWEIRRIVQSLTQKELRVLGLLSLGWGNERIGDHLCVSGDTAKACLGRASRRLKIHGRVALALFYVDYILPEDQLPNYKPGEKLAEWRTRAEELRAQLKAAGALTRQTVTAAMLLASPEHAGKTTGEMGALMRGPRGTPLSSDAYKAHLGKISRRLPGEGGREMARIAVIARLAPFDAA